MPACRRCLRLFVFFLAVVLPAQAVDAQVPAKVRVVESQAPIRRWFRNPVRDILLYVQSGTVLEVLDRERDWYWIITPPDAHGTRKGGWIEVAHVEPVVEAPRSAASAAASVLPAASEPAAPSVAPAAEAASVPEDKVAIRAGSTTYKFDDVHFDRDRSTLRGEAVGTLTAVVAAMKGDPALTLNLEGYACSLGSAAYNLELGARRAESVKSYLMTQGIAAERLRTSSQGEEHPVHDNSREETRRLNRRVAIVPNAAR
jgi:outer membrane protein OmpA-like peptidoglycan-associated protein